ncbi:MAG: hypothetical protein L0Z62_16330 [Gemmataceae bacterium]|nr:hypothetical protein [Gemmataceae bacterium]
MSHSLCLLTATWLAAQAPPPSPYPLPLPGGEGRVRGPAAVRVEQGPVVEYAPGYSNGWVSQGHPPRSERRGLFARLQAFFSGKNHQRKEAYQWQGHPTATPIPHPPIHTNEPPLVNPGKAAQPIGPQSALPRSPVAQAAHNPAPAPARLKLPVREPYRDKIGHDGRYGWVTGQLVRLESGRDLLWVIVYATPEMEDLHGGSLLLNPVVEMMNFRDGDLVSVRGELLNGGRPSQHFGMLMYRAVEVNLIERGD